MSIFKIFLKGCVCQSQKEKTGVYLATVWKGNQILLLPKNLIYIK